MKILLLIMLSILTGKLFAQELFYDDDGMQWRGYSVVDTTLTFSKKIHLDKGTYVLKRINAINPYLVSGSDTIRLPETILLDKSDSVEYFVLYNSGNKPIKLLRQDGSLITIKEAMNYQNKWLPVEFWNYSWCGNSYYPISVNPGQLLLLKTCKLKGGRPTYMRLRLKSESNGILVSQAFESSVNPNYFVLNTDLKKYLPASSKWFCYLK